MRLVKSLSECPAIQVAVFVPAITLSFVFPTICAAQGLDMEGRDYLSGFAQSGDFSTFEAPDAPGPGKLSLPDEPARGQADEAATRTRLGLLEFERDGRVCVDFADGTGACDLFIRNGGLHLKLTEDGSDFPIYFGLEGE